MSTCVFHQVALISQNSISQAVCAAADAGQSSVVSPVSVKECLSSSQSDCRSSFYKRMTVGGRVF